MSPFNGIAQFYYNRAMKEVKNPFDCNDTSNTIYCLIETWPVVYHTKINFVSRMLIALALLFPIMHVLCGCKCFFIPYTSFNLVTWAQLKEPPRLVKLLCSCYKCPSQFSIFSEKQTTAPLRLTDPYSLPNQISLPVLWEGCLYIKYLWWFQEFQTIFYTCPLGMSLSTKRISMHCLILFCIATIYQLIFNFLIDIVFTALTILCCVRPMLRILIFRCIPCFINAIKLA